MTIEIHEPELEALIRDRMETGKYRNVEEALIQALKTSPLTSEAGPRREPRQNLADFLLESPLHGSGLVIERIKEYPRDIDL